MNPFEYYAPRSAKEAAALLKKHPKAMVLAGGTDLLVRMKGRVLRPSAVIDVKRLPKASDITYSAKSGLSIGPAVTMRQVELSPEVRKHYPGLAEGAAFVGSIQIRNRATVVGNVCNAAPSADSSPGLVVHGAKVKIVGPNGRRTMTVENFVKGPGKTDLKRGEFVAGIQVPPPGKRTGSAYVRHTPREAMDIAVVGVGVCLELSGSKVKRASICLGAVAPVPLRATEAEKALEGKLLTAESIQEAAEAAANAARPITDVRASAEFRTDMVKVLTERMIDSAAARAQGTKSGRRAA